ncbi:MAG: hypothetical protein CMJ58_01300 [Planctomycetaceae bacterium]|nr:hypothetical protein [Planctomycetaceae bacterium]
MVLVHVVGSRESRLIRLALLAIATLPWGGVQRTVARETVVADGVEVRYSGLTQQQAESIARTVSSARAICVEKFRFDMPATIAVDAAVNSAAPVRLFNDGADHFSLSVHDAASLRRPQASGTFHLYGLCHEVAHLAMYRPIQQRRWMTTAAAEGWAHYLGSRIIDEVYQRQGESLWWDPYDYRADGMQRLRAQLAESEPGEVARGAGLWLELAEIIGDDKLAPLMAAWGQAEVDLQQPGAALLAALQSVASDPAVAQWWQRAEPVLVRATPRSPFDGAPPADGMLTQIEHEVVADDGRPAGKRSTAGGGHAVRSTAPAGQWLLTAVRVFGSRYGRPDSGSAVGSVWLCDAENREIASFDLPYDKFPYGGPDWVRIDVPPTLVPDEFIVGVSFNPTATRGVFVSHDASPEGESLSALPGREPAAFDAGDWLLRPVLALHAAPRTWTDKTGKFSVEATLTNLQDEQVTLLNADGKPVTLPAAKLCDADREYLQTVASAVSGDGDEPTTEPAPRQRPREVAADDGTPTGRKSLPQGNAVLLEAGTGGGLVTAVRIHGSRYGAPRVPAGAEFTVAVCDEQFQPLGEFTFPLSKFPRGNAKWVTVRVEPTKVPERFVVCTDFAATSTLGVFVSHDAEGEGLVGKPGQPAGTFTGGDWLIRAVVAPAE